MLEIKTTLKFSKDNFLLYTYMYVCSYVYVCLIDHIKQKVNNLLHCFVNDDDDDNDRKIGICMQ